jgi:hypothetical protein
VGKIVDAIGGVWFDVPYDMSYHDPYQDLVIEQAKGYRLLSGDDAMQVIRWRKNDGSSGIGDSGRMEIQQNFLKAVIKQMLTIQNVGNLNKIAKVFQDNVETNLSFQNILWFAQKAFMGGLSVDDVEFLTMPWKSANVYSRYYTKLSGKYTELNYVFPIGSQLLEIVNEKLSPFVEKFTLSDLDIMSVNSDGSISSSTGYVEDKQAAVAPVKTTTTTTTQPDDGATEDPVVDENGDTTVPDGDVSDLPVDPSGTDTTTPDLTQPGSIIDPGTFTDPSASDTPSTEPNDTPAEETPVTPTAPDEPSGTDFAVTEQPPAE